VAKISRLLVVTGDMRSSTLCSNELITGMQSVKQISRFLATSSVQNNNSIIAEETENSSFQSRLTSTIRRRSGVSAILAPFTDIWITYLLTPAIWTCVM